MADRNHRAAKYHARHSLRDNGFIAADNLITLPPQSKMAIICCYFQKSQQQQVKNPENEWKNEKRKIKEITELNQVCLLQHTSTSQAIRYNNEFAK